MVGLETEIETGKKCTKRIITTKIKTNSCIRTIERRHVSIRVLGNE